MSLVNPEFIDGVYDELKKMWVDLDSDPISFGPKRLQNKVAEARNMLTQVQRLITELSHRLHTVRRSLRGIEAEIEIKTSHMLSNDNDVKQCKSVKDREAMAQFKLNDLFIEKIKTSSSEFELDSVLITVKSKEKDLKDVLARLRDQMKLCQDEISLGDSWGKMIPSKKNDDSDDVDKFFKTMVEQNSDSVEDHEKKRNNKDVSTKQKEETLLESMLKNGVQDEDKDEDEDEDNKRDSLLSKIDLGIFG